MAAAPADPADIARANQRTFVQRLHPRRRRAERVLSNQTSGPRRFLRGRPPSTGRADARSRLSPCTALVEPQNTAVKSAKKLAAQEQDAEHASEEEEQHDHLDVVPGGPSQSKGSAHANSKNQKKISEGSGFGLEPKWQWITCHLIIGM